MGTTRKRLNRAKFNGRTRLVADTGFADEVSVRETVSLFYAEVSVRVTVVGVNEI